MTQFSTFSRVFSLLGLILFLLTSYFVAYRSQFSTSSVKTAISEHWDHGLSLLSKPTSHHESTAGQRIDDLQKLVDQLVDAKLAQIASFQRIAELKKRATTPTAQPASGPTSSTTPDPLGLKDMVSGMTEMSPAKSRAFGASISSAISGAIGKLTSGAEDAILGSLQGAAGGLGEGLAGGAVDGLKLPKKAGVAVKNETGISGIAQSLGHGLSSTITAQVDPAPLSKGVDVASAARGLAVGLANGAAMGTKLSTKNLAPPPGNTTADITNNFGFSITNTFLSAIDQTKIKAMAPSTDALYAQIAQAIVPTANGLAVGAAYGLKLTSPGVTQLQLQVDPKNPQLPAIAHDFSQALASSFLRNVDLSTLQPTQEQKDQTQRMIFGALPSIGQGIGTGAVAGVGFAKQGLPPNPPPSDVNSGVQDFSYQLVQSFLSSVDVSKAASMLPTASPEQVQALQKTIFGTLPGIGNGIGTGTAAGLGLSKNVGPSPPATDINGGTEGLARQLTQSLFSSLDMAKIAEIAQSAPKPTIMLGSAAEGLGKGFGEGAAIGLGLKANIPMMNVSNADTSAVTETFSRNLVVGFLTNGTLKGLQANLASLPPVTQTVKIAQVAEGFGRGLMGGVQNGLGLPVPANASVFDDSIMGGSVGLGKGLGESGVSLVMTVISGNPNILETLALSSPFSAPPPAAPPPASPDPSSRASVSPASPDPSPRAPSPDAPSPTPQAPPPASPDPSAPQPPVSPNPAVPAPDAALATQAASPATPPGNGLARREDSSVKLSERAMSTLNTSAAVELVVSKLNVTQINGYAQKGLDAVGCIGFGGVFALQKGLINSGLLKFDPLKNKIPEFGNTTFTVFQDKNEFKVAPGQGSVAVNGVKLDRLILLLATHITLGIFAFFVFMPISLMLSATRDIQEMLGRPQIWPKSARFQLITELLGVVPFSVLSVGTGILSIGYGKHLDTYHKGLGYLLFILGFVWIALNRSDNPTLKTANMAVVALTSTVALAANVTGWRDLATSSLCLTQTFTPEAYIGLALLFGFLFSGGSVVVLLVMLMKYWMQTPRNGSWEEKGFINRGDDTSPTARELRRISGPFLSEQQQAEQDLQQRL